MVYKEGISNEKRINILSRLARAKKIRIFIAFERILVYWSPEYSQFIIDISHFHANFILLISVVRIFLSSSLTLFIGLPLHTFYFVCPFESFSFLIWILYAVEWISAEEYEVHDKKSTHGNKWTSFEFWSMTKVSQLDYHQLLGQCMNLMERTFVSLCKLKYFDRYG